MKKKSKRKPIIVRQKRVTANQLIISAIECDLNGIALRLRAFNVSREEWIEKASLAWMHASSVSLMWTSDDPKTTVSAGKGVNTRFKVK